MEARILANLRVLVATLFVTLATLGPVSSKVYADPNPGSQGNTVKHKVVTITPVKPIPTPPVCSRGEPGKRPPAQNYVFNFKTPEHYRYEVKGQKLVSGASFPANGQTVTITAVPDSGHTFGKATASWEYTLTPVRCGG
jgi:hypothetical protein